MSDWKFGRRHGQCESCQREFAADEAHVSALVIEAEEPQREDVCLECWQSREVAETLFWWRTHHRVGKKRGLALNLEALEAFFLALEDKQDRTLRELRYILCLILMRKRRLKIVRILRGKEGEAMLVRRPRRKESLRVWVYDFSPERMDELRIKLVRIFDGDEGDLLGTAESSTSPAADVDSDSGSDSVSDPASDPASDLASDEPGAGSLSQADAAQDAGEDLPGGAVDPASSALGPDGEEHAPVESGASEETGQPDRDPETGESGEVVRPAGSASA